MRRVEAWKFPLLLLVVATHLWIGWTLARYRPSAQQGESFLRPTSDDPEVLTVLRFESREPPARARAPGPAQVASPGRRRETRLGDARSQDAAAPVGAPSAREGFVLDLRPPPPRDSFRPPDPLGARPRALAFEPTRFDGAWISEGDLTHVLARRSMVAGAILGALGALRKPCTERERREYDRDCVPDQYRHPLPGE